MDTDKGLISSSSSSTRPMSEELRSKLLALSNRVFPPPPKGLISSSSSSSSSSSTRPTPMSNKELAANKELAKKLRSELMALSNLDFSTPLVLDSWFPNTPIKCIDPDDPSSWEHLEESFTLRKRFFSPNQLPLVPGREIWGNSVFELYSITITKLDPLQEFSSIYMRGTNTCHKPVIIYKRPAGEEITLNQPLPLKNIFRPPSARNNVTIALSNPAADGWAFRYGISCISYFDRDNVKYRQDRQVVKDKRSGSESEAVICYELIESAAIAELEFTFDADRNLPIKIFSGSITATTDGHPFTERIIRQFSEPSVLQTNVPVPVNRSVFGVSSGKTLCIHVTFEVAVGPIIRTIGETIELSAPNETKSDEGYITIIKDKGKGKSIRMRVKVSWWNIMP